MTASPIRKRVVVSGRVQGVFFRDTCRREALAHGVAGSVSNLPDGNVQAIFEGSPEAVNAMIAWCREGTEWSHVESVDVSDERPAGQAGFQIS